MEGALGRVLRRLRSVCAAASEAVCSEEVGMEKRGEERKSEAKASKRTNGGR